MEENYKNVARLIMESDSFLIASHIDPDGDAVGCELAIWSVINRLGKSAKVVSEEPIPEAFAFISGSEEVVTSGPVAAEVAVVVDASSIERVGRVEKLVRECEVIINIDHHQSNENFGEHNLVDEHAGAYGEIIYRLIRSLGVTPTVSEAEALYTAILSDTGCFRFPNTTGDTLRIAGDLLDLGVNAHRVASEIFWKRSPAGLRVLGDALSTIEITNGGAVATMEVTAEMYKKTGASSRDTEGFANYPRSVRDVMVGVLIREIGGGLFRVSLRSREGYPIADVAKSFGGGGHPTAAGFRIEGDLEGVKASIRRRIETTTLKPDSTPTS
jgi:phosphoesterase RecJ-like protein